MQADPATRMIRSTTGFCSIAAHDPNPDAKSTRSVHPSRARLDATAQPMLDMTTLVLQELTVRPAGLDPLVFDAGLRICAFPGFGPAASSNTFPTNQGPKNRSNRFAAWVLRAPAIRVSLR